MNAIDNQIKELGSSYLGFDKKFGCDYKTLCSIRDGKAQISGYVRYADIVGEDPVAVMAVATGVIDSFESYVPSSNPHVKDRDFIGNGLNKTVEERGCALVRAGLSRDIHYDWTLLRNTPTPSSLVRFARALDANPIDLLTWGYEMHKMRLSRPPDAIPAKRKKVRAKTVAAIEEKSTPEKPAKPIKELLQKIGHDVVGLSESEFNAVIARATVPKSAAVKRIARTIGVEPVELWQWLAKQDEPDDRSVLSDAALLNPLKTRVRKACGAHSVEWFCERNKIPKRILDDALGRVAIPTVHLVRLAKALEIPPVSLWRWIARV